MTITCTTCGYEQNAEGTEYCDSCGAALTAFNSPPPTMIPPIPEPITPDFPVTPVNISTKARLIAKQPSPPIAEFPLEGAALIGIFDPDTGPVDIDLEAFLGNETVSRNHAEIYRENGTWKIKDLGSTNGVFIKPLGQTRFSARINAPTTLNSGDEIAIAKIRFLFETV